ncbi:MAG: hypothetical protein KY461_00990 [Actinobacteria bacterium]|nr:hypothetical protein [Actinomycetota bacterium]
MGDGFGPVGRQLRQGVGGELRAEAEETERLAALAARRRRSLADVAADLLARGDTVAVDVPGRRFTGRVVHAAADVMRVRTVSGAVDVPLRGPVTLSVVERARAGGVDHPGGPSSFRSRLLELELEGAAVELGDAATGDTVVGRLTAVAVDHAVVVGPGGTERYVSLAGIAYVRVP